jgi:hypothetical protein
MGKVLLFLSFWIQFMYSLGAIRSLSMEWQSQTSKLNSVQSSNISVIDIPPSSLLKICKGRIWDTKKRNDQSRAQLQKFHFVVKLTYCKHHLKHYDDSQKVYPMHMLIKSIPLLPRTWSQTLRSILSLFQCLYLHSF